MFNRDYGLASSIASMAFGVAAAAPAMEVIGPGVRDHWRPSNSISVANRWTGAPHEHCREKARRARQAEAVDAARVRRGARAALRAGNRIGPALSRRGSAL